MFDKNRSKKVGLCLMVITSCLVLAVLWTVLATPDTALAKKPDKPPGGGKPEVLHGSATFRDDPNDPDDPGDPFDRVCSDGLGPYYDSVDFTELGLCDGFFRLTIKLKKNAGRSLNLSFPVGIDPAFFPMSENIWILSIEGTLTDWRAQTKGVRVLREAALMFGQTGKDEALVSYGRRGGDYLTVTLTGDDVWTIESLTTDEAVFYRHDVQTVFGSGPMPFLVTYEGQ